MAVITEAELRSKTLGGCVRTFAVPSGAVLTPDARKFAAEKNIVLAEARETSDHAPMSVDHSMKRGEYRVLETGETTHEKPEEMTHLHANVLVSKEHPRIALRGKLDTLQALIISLQCDACAAGDTALVGALGELLAFSRTLLACEVKEEMPPETHLFGYDDAQLRERSHDPERSYGVGHMLPDYTMGRLAVSLNYLRTQVRETELAAARAFPSDSRNGKAIIRALNRMSSAVYLLYCESIKKAGEAK